MHPLSRCSATNDECKSVPCSLHRYPVQRHAAATPCRRLPLPFESTPRQCPRGRAHDSTASLDEPVFSRVCPPPYRGHVRPGFTLRPSLRASIVEAGRAPYRARCAHRHGPSWVEQGPAPPQRQGRLAQPLACPPGLAAAGGGRSRKGDGLLRLALGLGHRSVGAVGCRPQRVISSHRDILHSRRGFGSHRDILHSQRGFGSHRDILHSQRGFGSHRDILHSRAERLWCASCRLARHLDLRGVHVARLAFELLLTPARLLARCTNRAPGRNSVPRHLRQPRSRRSGGGGLLGLWPGRLVRCEGIRPARLARSLHPTHRRAQLWRPGQRVRLFPKLELHPAYRLGQRPISRGRRPHRRPVDAEQRLPNLEAQLAHRGRHRRRARRQLGDVRRAAHATDQPDPDHAGRHTRIGGRGLSGGASAGGSGTWLTGGLVPLAASPPSPSPWTIRATRSRTVPSALRISSVACSWSSILWPLTERTDSPTRSPAAAASPDDADTTGGVPPSPRSDSPSLLSTLALCSNNVRTRGGPPRGGSARGTGGAGTPDATGAGPAVSASSACGDAKTSGASAGCCGFWAAPRPARAFPPSVATTDAAAGGGGHDGGAACWHAGGAGRSAGRENGWALRWLASVARASNSCCVNALESSAVWC
eukprot:scaffold11797_cov123-Isochrysis_galbana.AAC.8